MADGTEVMSTIQYQHSRRPQSTSSTTTVTVLMIKLVQNGRLYCSDIGTLSTAVDPSLKHNAIVQALLHLPLVVIL